MHSWQTMEITLEYIEEHLDEEIPTTTLANMAGLSPFYYQRLFKRLVDKPVQEYIKLRRLAKIIKELQNTKRRILDIALDYGFNDHANFTRAFKETYHITPQEYRASQPMLNTFDKPNLSSQYTMIDENVPLLVDNMVLEIEQRTVTTPEIYLGLEATVDIKKQVPVGKSTGIDVPGQLWQTFHKTKETSSTFFIDNQELGMSYGANPKLGTFQYFVGGKVQTDVNKKGMIIQTIPANQYLVCKIEAPTFEELVTTALNQASSYLFNTWLCNRNLVTLPFSIEKYNRDATIPYMEIWVVPITK